MVREGMFLGDRYEIISQIGTGGMSDVYRALDHKLNRYVAVKVLKGEFSQDSNFVSKFVVEAQSAAGLSHPNIVNVYDVGNESGIHYIVMELVEGITLKSYIEKKGRLTFKEAVSIAIQVGMGIEAAHNNKIIHRDIKPQNIIISRDGKVKVTDFGIARAVTSNTISSSVMGSVHYTSPEQARGGYVDERSDIYSLGITLYEMVTGRVPYNAESAVTIAVMHIQEEMIPPSRFVDDLPVSVEQIILKCTQKNSDRRYHNVGDLVMDLKRSLVEPDGDFVNLQSDLYDNPTAVMSEADIKTIKERYPELNGSSQDDTPIEKNSYNDDDDYDDEDDDREVNPKLDKAIIALGIGAGVIILLILLYLGGNALGLFKFSGGGATKSSTSVADDKVQMIDITGKSYDEAKKLLNDLGLGIKQTKEEETDKYPKGYVISQSIQKGQTVAKNTTIEVAVSSGAASIVVPSVLGLEEQAAVNRLSDYKLRAVRDYKYDDNVEAGQVISQSPEEDEKAKEGDTVNLIISRGREDRMVTVPDLRGKSQASAKTLLESKGLKLGEVTNVYSETYKRGEVCEQSEAPGTSIMSGSVINISVSEGNTSVEVPNVLGQIEVQAKAMLKNSEFEVSVHYVAPEGESVGTVLKQEPAVGDYAPQGSTVTIYVGKNE
ncbi:MAG: Stk1 family PASTA domain-containing Ser/Thr kinase [Lachnospiraceae bacterium]|nr:Stk1 family PASTA domain-containing Ser/Thr kinase [Lachnospiraceae bacterium]